MNLRLFRQILHRQRHLVTINAHPEANLNTATGPCRGAIYCAPGLQAGILAPKFWGALTRALLHVILEAIRLVPSEAEGRG